MNEYEYMDRTKWSDKDLLETYNMEDYPYEKGQAMKAAILARMGNAQDDEWEERELHNEIMQQGDIFRIPGRDDEPLISYWFGKNSDNFCYTDAKIIRRVPKTKPYSDHASEPVDTSNDLPKIAVCPTCGTALGVEDEKPEKPGVRFAIAGTPDAELPGVVALELEDTDNKIYIKCHNEINGYLLGINKYTGKVARAYFVNCTLGLPLDDQGRLVIE